MSTIFQQIIEGAIPADIVFENETILAFKDISPQAPVHILIIPKKHFKDIQSVPKADLSVIQEIFEVAQTLAEKFGIQDGYRLTTNNGSTAGQSVFHLHFHLMGGKALSHNLA